MQPPITLYALSTCDHCHAAREFFQARGLVFTDIVVDRLIGPPRNDAMHVLNKYAMFPTFPTILIGDAGLVGFRPEEIEGILSRYGREQ